MELELPFITAFEPDVYKRAAETAKAFIDEQTRENKENLIESFKELQMDSEDWKEYKADQKQRRAERLPDRTEEIMALENDGYMVEQKTDYHFRINETLDLYPIHNRFHNLKSGRRGGYKIVKEIIEKELNKKSNG